jgi:hypothetical protein
MLTKQEFIRQLFELKDQYRQDNQWVGKWTESWNDEDVMTRFIEAAYSLYHATSTNRLKLTLLGGTEIRLDRPLVKAFGVTGVTGVQDPQTKLWVQFAMYSRTHTAQGAGAGPYSRNPDRVPAPVTGSGSILSEKQWTPILNDCLILGAITAGQDFVLAFTPEEQHDWEVLNASKVTKVQVLASRFGETPALKNAWKEFLNAHARMFFDSFGPRVFAREILGLKWFGYRAEFTWHQLGFFPGSGRREMPNFRTYVTKLHNVHFHSPCDRVKIREEISTFLFGDAKALGSSWPTR